MFTKSLHHEPEGVPSLVFVWVLSGFSHGHEMHLWLADGANLAIGVTDRLPSGVMDC